MLGKIRKRIALLFVTLFVFSWVFAGTAWAGVTDSSLTGFTITTGPAPYSAVTSGSLLEPPASPLSPGEVLVGKSIVYNMDTSVSTPGTPDGTVTVTLSAQAQTYNNTDGVLSDPLVPMANGAFVTVTDDIGELYVLGGLPAGVTQNGTMLTWNIMTQTTSDLLGASPLTVSYTLTVVNPNSGGPNPPYTMDYWYSSGIANAAFEPAGDNPYYYTMQEEVESEFLMSMNWNNGNGLNNGAIIDNSLGLTIVFPKNISAQNMNPYNSDGTMNTAGQWNWWPQVAGTQNQAATVVSTTGVISYYTWQLNWSQGNAAKTYTFTVKDFPKTGIDTQYEIEFLTGGGSQAFAGGKIVISQSYFQRTYNSSLDDPFYWSGQTINAPLNVMEQIKLSTTPPEVFSLGIFKAFAPGDNHAAWGMTPTTLFEVMIQDDATGFYLVFDGSPRTEYSYTGMASTGTPIQFSALAPAELLGIPITDDAGVVKSYTVTEISTWGSTAQVTQTYSLVVNSSPAVATNVIDSPSEGDTVKLTVTNDFTNQPAGVLRLLKLFDGYPDDWGITSSTEFQVKIWDTVAGNYLLFVAPDAQARADGWAPPTWSWSAPAGTLYCVGNDGSGSGGTGAWTFSDTYWQGRYAAGTATVITTIPLYELKMVGAMNLWPSTYEIHELDFSGNLLSASPDNIWWQAYTSIQQITRVQQAATADEITAGGVYLATVTNFFQHGDGRLYISKKLQGSPGDWSINDDTIFTIRVKNMTSGSYLLFDPILQSDGTLWHVGSGSIDSNGIITNITIEDLSWAGNENDLIGDLELSVNSPIVLSNIFTGNDYHYMIEEPYQVLSTPQFFAGTEDITNADSSGGIVVDPSGSVAVTIVNTYMPLSQGASIVIIDNVLKGAWSYFVTVDTPFTLTFVDVVTGRTLLFVLDEDQPNYVYTFFGEVDSDGLISQVDWDTVPPSFLPPQAMRSGAPSPNVLFSEREPAILLGLIPGVYKVYAEIYPPPIGGTLTYTVSGPVYIVDGVGNGVFRVEVINTYAIVSPGGGGGGGGGGQGEGGDSLSANTGDDRDIEGWSTALLLSALGLLSVLFWIRIRIL